MPGARRGDRARSVERWQATGHAGRDGFSGPLGAAVVVAGDGVVAAGGGAEDGGSEGHELVHVPINYITTCTILWVDPSSGLTPLPLMEFEVVDSLLETGWQKLIDVTALVAPRN